MIEQFKHILKNALHRLYTEDFSLVERGGMEQACVSRVYYYLQNAINEVEELYQYNLDCEYNKNGDDPKWCFDKDTGKKFKTRPDMILHKRGNNRDNKVVIEFKGWWNNSTESDIRKLKAFTDKRGTYKYDLGIFIKLEKTEHLLKLQYYVNGKSIN